MATTPKPDKDDRVIPDDREIDVWRRQEIDINRRQERINESDDSYMQAPNPWPDPPEDEDKDA